MEIESKSHPFQVFHVDKARMSDYTIQPRDILTQDMQITAISAHPVNSNVILIAYEPHGLVLWDLSRRRILRQYSLADKDSERYPKVSQVSSIAWHSSGKRFVAGYAQGFLAFFRMEKSHGQRFYVNKPVTSEDEWPDYASVAKLNWVSSPVSAGVIVLSGGYPISKDRAFDGLTILQPASMEMSADESLALLTKSAAFPWTEFNIETSTHCIDFAVVENNIADDVVLPSHLIVLAGSPMDGFRPTVSTYRINQMKLNASMWKISPSDQPAMQLYSPLMASDITALHVIESTNTILRAELLAATKDSTFNEWPIDGGIVDRPTLKTFAGIDSNKSTILVTGFANGSVSFWESLSPADHSSNGSLYFLHTLSIPDQLLSPPEDPAIRCIQVCPDARVLAVGMHTGEIAVFTIQDGFALKFRQHIHSCEISKMSLSTASGYLASADTFGVVSLIDLETTGHSLPVFEVSLEEEKSITSLLITQVKQVPILMVGRGAGGVEFYQLSTGTLVTVFSSGQMHSHPPSQLILLDEGRIAADPELKAETIEMAEQFTVVVPPGPIGLTFADAIESHAVIETCGPVFESSGVRSGFILVQINDINVSSLKLTQIRDKMSELVDMERSLVFIDGSATQSESSQEFLLTISGKTVEILPIEMAKAADLAAGELSVKMDPIIRIDLDTYVKAVQVVDAPAGDRVEKCLVCVDTAGCVSVRTLLALQLVWRSDYLFNFPDMNAISITSFGEIVLTTENREIKRFSIFSEPILTETNMFLASCVHPRLFCEEKRIDAEERVKQKEERRKSSAGDLLKKFMTGKPIELDQIFTMSQEEENRRKLFGDSSAKSPPKAEQQLASTKETLQQTGENLNLRGEKLSDLRDKTEQMKSTSEEFYQMMKKFNEKEASKKWWQI